MKTTRLTASVLAAGVCALGWLTLFTQAGAVMQYRKQTAAEAQDLAQRGLYELAVEAYGRALEADGSKELYTQLLDTCEEYYSFAHTGTVRGKTAQAFDAAVKAYPRESAFWERYAQLYIDEERWKDAADVLRRAEASHASSDLLEQQYLQVYYTTDTLYGAYTSAQLQPCDDMYTVEVGGQWGTVDSDGKSVLDAVYRYVGPIGDDGIALCVTQEGEARLVDSDGVIHARFDAAVEQAMAWGDGLIAVRLEGRDDWCYLNERGEEVLQGYSAAGRFQDGHAAVQTDEGWQIIDKTGAAEGEVWQEIRLDNTGAFLSGKQFWACADGKWQIRSLSGKESPEFSCDAVDLDLGEGIAFEQDGKWGFVNDDGEVFIEPQYDMARSFSGGTAAVQSDGKWGFIDKKGRIVVEYQFFGAGYFSGKNGGCMVQTVQDGPWQLIRWAVEH